MHASTVYSFLPILPSLPALSLSLLLFNSLCQHRFHHFTLLILYIIISTLLNKDFNFPFIFQNKNVASLSWSIAYYSHYTLGL